MGSRNILWRSVRFYILMIQFISLCCLLSDHGAHEEFQAVQNPPVSSEILLLCSLNSNVFTPFPIPSSTKLWERELGTANKGS